MEMTCSRCHQPVPGESCYCPACGLPQLVYSSEGESVPPASEKWPEPARDAASIDWKFGMRAALALGVPAGLLCSGISPLALLGIFWMTGAAAWAVILYMKSQGPGWITIGAGARIGLVTGLIAAWLAFGVSGVGLFVGRVVMHQGNQLDAAWRETVEMSHQKEKQWLAQMNIPNDQGQADAQRSLMLSPEGHAGFQTLGLLWSGSLLVLFGVGGGALGARMASRNRRQT